LGVLDVVLSENQNISTAKLSAICLQIARALEYLAMVNIIHNRISSKSIFLTYTSDKRSLLVKLADFEGAVSGTGFLDADITSLSSYRSMALEVLTKATVSTYSGIVSCFDLIARCLVIWSFGLGNLSLLQPTPLRQVIIKTGLY
jgi:hypothetical protein